MTHPIAPSPALVTDWLAEALQLNQSTSTRHSEKGRIAEHIATEAARWGADQELDACVGYVDTHVSGNRARAMREARRPKPPSLKEQALEALYQIESEFPAGSFGDTIRRALEVLPDE